jgi:hypothetical protein
MYKPLNSRRSWRSSFSSKSVGLAAPMSLRLTKT